jgi:TonB family protein
MIPRILVPRDVHPLSPGEHKKPARRLETYMDERTVVPAGVSDAPPLDGKSAIPSHIPLDVLVNRTLVPRGLAVKPIERPQPLSEFAPVAVLDSRMVVPAYVEPAEPEEMKEFVGRPTEMTPELRELIEPDIFTTGDANLLIESEEKAKPLWDAGTRSASVVVHVLLVLFLVSIPKLFPPHVPTREEIELASRQLGVVYIAPDAIPKAPPGPPGPKVRITPKVLNEVAPPRPESHAPVAPPVAAPERPAADLPSAPTPRTSALPPPPQPTTPPPSQLLPVQPKPSGHLNLGLPSSSPGQAIQNQMSDALKSGGGTYRSENSLPGGGGGGGRGRGGGGASVGNAVQILTPTEGVDFQSYINRMLANIKRNWYAVMPESAMMGDKGMVFVTFQINSNGTVPMPDPNLERTSGKEPLDNAAMAAIRASNPFEPLPPQFHGPYIKLRIIFLYNLPLDYVQ